MITFSCLGGMGRLGNQMFQYASTIGIAKKNNYDYCFPLCNSSLPYYFDLTSKECINLNLKTTGEHTFHFNSKLFTNEDNLNYDGYLQSDKYFKHCSAFIKDEFNFKKEIRDKVNNWFLDKKYIAIHIRRGDYLENPNFHTNLPLEWYIKAMSKFTTNNFLIFSDDKEWCKQNFNSYEISPFLNEGEDLYAMTLCEGHIIANSTFSWWGAWLSNSKKVIAPKKWFGAYNDPPNSSKVPNSYDLYPDGWIVI